MEGLRKLGLPAAVTGFGAAFATHFGNETALRDYRDTLADDRDMLRRYLTAMLAEGVHIIPDGRMYVSIAHTEADVEQTLAAASRALKSV
jgi:glutamate-1-semialdehyde 2,1-aminomutase